MKKIIFLSLLCVCSIWNVQADIDVKAGKTSSGIEVWVREDPLTPVVAMRFSTDLGSVNDPQEREGALALLTQMMQRGTTHQTPEKLASTLQDIASSYGYEIDQDFFSGGFVTLKKYFTQMSSIFKETLMTPLLSQDNLDYVRHQHITALRVQESAPEYQLSKIVRENLFKNHPYMRDPLGTVKSVQKIDLKKDIEAMHGLLNRQSLKIVFVGNITLEEALKTAEDIFAGLPKESHVISVSDVTIIPKETVKVSSSNPQTLIQYFQKGLGFNDRDYQKFQILSSILGRLLKEKVRGTEGLAYYIMAFPDNKKHSSLFSIITATDSSRANKTLERIQEIIQSLKNDGISETYFKEAMSDLTGSFVLNFTTTPKIANHLNFLMRIGKDKDYINKRNELLKAVTFKDLTKFADSFVQDKDSLFVVYGKLSESPSKK